MVPDSPRLQVAAETGSASMGSLDPGDVFWGPSEQQSSQQPSSSPAQQGPRRSLDDSSVFNGTGGGQGVNQISLASSWLPLSFESLSASTAGGQTASQAPQRPSVFNPTPWDPSSSSVGINRFDGNNLMSGSWEDRSCSSRSMPGMLLQSQSMPSSYRNSNFDDIISQQRSSYDSPGNDHNRQPDSPKDADHYKRATTRRPHNDSSPLMSRRLSRASQHSSVSDEEDHHHHVNKKRGDKPKKALPEPAGNGLGDIDPAVLDALPQEDWKTLTSAGVRLAGTMSSVVPNQPYESVF